MEEITIIDEYGTSIYAHVSKNIDIVEVGVIGDYSAGTITKAQAKQLGQWLINQAK